MRGVKRLKCLSTALKIIKNGAFCPTSLTFYAFIVGKILKTYKKLFPRRKILCFSMSRKSFLVSYMVKVVSPIGNSYQPKHTRLGRNSLACTHNILLRVYIRDTLRLVVIGISVNWAECLPSGFIVLADQSYPTC